jgi:hypothetical protein
MDIIFAFCLMIRQCLMIRHAQTGRKPLMTVPEVLGLLGCRRTGSRVQHLKSKWQPNARRAALTAAAEGRRMTTVKNPSPIPLRSSAGGLLTVHLPSRATGIHRLSYPAIWASSRVHMPCLGLAGQERISNPLLLRVSERLKPGNFHRCR